MVFGGKKLPEIGAGLGKGIKAFRTGVSEVEETGKAIVEENVPGVKEVSALKEEVNKVKNFGSAKS